MGESPSYLAHVVKTRGVSFAPDSSFFTAVKQAGGDGILVERLSASDLKVSTASTPARSFEHMAKCAEAIYVGRREQALPDCAAAVDEEPESAWPILTTVRLRKEMDLPQQESAELLRRATQAEPNLLEAHAELSEIAQSPEEQGAEIQKMSSLRRAEAADEYSSLRYEMLMPESLPEEDGPVPEDAMGPYQKQIESLLDRFPDMATTHVQAGAWYALTRDMEKMRQQFQEAIRLEPGNPTIHLNLASLYFHFKNTEAGLAEIHGAIGLAPYRSDLRQRLTKELLRENRRDDAIHEWKEFLALSPTDVAGSDALVELYMDGKQRKEAIAELRRSLKASSSAANDQAKYVSARIRDLDLLGHLLCDEKDFKAAEEQYQFLQRYKPDESTLHNNLGNVFYAEKHCEEASREYQEALRLQPDLPDAHHNLANCLLATQKADEAIAEYKQTLELDPSKVQSRMMIGAALLQKGELNSAIEEFHQALDMEPGNAQLRMLLGHAYYLNKDLQAAIPELKRAIEIQPDFPMAENDLAWIYATAEERALRNPSEALRLARHAVKGSPQPVAAILDTLAEALLLNGQAAEALKTEQEAVTADPKNTEFQTRLAHFQEAYAASLRSSK